VREAEQHAAEDQRRRELIEARNQADTLIYSTEKNLREYGSHVGDADRRAIEDAIASLRTAMSGDDVNAIRQRAEALAQVAARLAEAMAQPDAASGAGPQGGPAAGADDVVDAEFEDVDDKKRRAS